MDSGSNINTTVAGWCRVGECVPTTTEVDHDPSCASAPASWVELSAPSMTISQRLDVAIDEAIMDVTLMATPYVLQGKAVLDETTYRLNAAVDGTVMASAEITQEAGKMMSTSAEVIRVLVQGAAEEAALVRATDVASVPGVLYKHTTETLDHAATAVSSHTQAMATSADETLVEAERTFVRAADQTVRAIHATQVTVEAEAARVTNGIRSAFTSFWPTSWKSAMYAGRPEKTDDAFQHPRSTNHDSRHHYVDDVDLPGHNVPLTRNLAARDASMLRSSDVFPPPQVDLEAHMWHASTSLGAHARPMMDVDTGNLAPRPAAPEVDAPPATDHAVPIGHPGHVEEPSPTESEPVDMNDMDNPGDMD